jgi:hypothetical protein
MNRLESPQLHPYKFFHGQITRVCQWRKSVSLFVYLLLGLVQLVFAAPELKFQQSSIVADGRQEALLLISGLKLADVEALTWNVPSSKLSIIFPVSSQTLACYFRPDPQIGASNRFRIVGRLGNQELAAELLLLAPIEILSSKAQLILGEDQQLILGISADVLVGAELYMKSTLGEIESEDGSRRWKVVLPPDLNDPAIFTVQLYRAEQPNLVLAQRNFSIIKNKNLTGFVEADSTLWIEMAGKTLGPFNAKDSLPVLPLQAGIENVTFIAKDLAGNETRLERKVKTPPLLNLTLVPENDKIMMGGYRCRIALLGDFSGDLTHSVEYGTLSDLKIDGAQKRSFVYTSPVVISNDIKFDHIEVQAERFGKVARQHLKMRLLPCPFDHTEVKVLATQKAEDGSYEITYGMRLLDSTGVNLKGQKISLKASVGQVGEILENGDGNYRFTLVCPAGIALDKVSLDFYLSNPSDGQMQLFLWSPANAQNPNALVLLTNGEGRALGNQECIINIENSEVQILKSNAIGLLSIPVQPKSEEGFLRMTVAFKDQPEIQREILLSPWSELREVIDATGQAELADDLRQALAQASSGDPISILANLPFKDGQMLDIVSDPTPKQLILKLSNNRLLGDGQSQLKGEIYVLNADGLPVLDAIPNISAVVGSLSTLSSAGSGKYTFDYTGIVVEQQQMIEVIAEYPAASLRESSRIKLYTANDSGQSDVLVSEDSNPVTTGDPSSESPAGTDSGIENMTPTEVTTAPSTDATTGTNPDASTSNPTTSIQDPIIEIIILAAPQISTSVSEGRLGKTATLSIQQLTEGGQNAPDGTVVKLAVSGLGTVSTTSVSLSSGKGQATYTFADADGTATITVFNEGGTGSVSLTSVARKVQSPKITLSQNEVSYDDTVDVQAEVKYDDGQTVDDGTPVTFSWSGETKTSNTSGGKASYTLKSVDVEQDVVLTVSTSGGSATASLKMHESEKPPITLKWLSSNPKTIRIGETLDLQVQVNSGKGTAVKDGYELDWSVTSGSLANSSTATSGGKISNTWTPGTSIGTSTMNVRYGSVSLSLNITIKAGPVDRDKSTLTFSVNPLSGDGASSTSLVAEFRDAYNNLIEGESVDFKINTNDDYVGSLSKTKDTTDGSGLASTIYNAGFGQGDILFKAYPSASATDSIEASLQQIFAPVELIITNDSAGLNTPPVTIFAGESLNLFAIARDGAQNVVDNWVVDWTLTLGVGSTVSNGDLVVHADKKSAIFSGRGVGKASISITTLSTDTVKLITASYAIEVFPGAVGSYRLSRSSSTSLSTGVLETIQIEALDAFQNVVTTMSTPRALTFSGLSSSGSFNPTVIHGGTELALGSAQTISFGSGVAHISLKAVKVESASLRVSDSIGPIEEQALSLTVMASGLASYTVDTVQLSGTSTLHLLATAFDGYGNAIADYAPLQNIAFTLSTGTQSSSTLSWFDLPSGMSSLGDGSAVVTAGSTSAFDSQGRLLVGVANTLSESNVFQVQEGSVSARSNAFSWTPNAATQLVYEVHPVDEILQDDIWSSFSVKVLDDFGNLVTDNGRLVSLTIVGGQGTLTQSTATTVNGIATFDQVVATQPGVLQFQASALGLRSALTWEVEIFGGAPASINLTGPSSVVAGTDASFSVEVMNGGGTRVKNYVGTIIPSSTDGTATLPALSFTLSDVGLKNYVVKFNQSGTQTLTLTEQSLPSVTKTSSGVVVSAAAPQTLRFVNLGATIVQNKSFPTVQVEVIDAFGNRVLSSTPTITLSLISGSGVLSGSLSPSAISGLASFGDVQYNTVENITLRASSIGLISVDSGALSVVASGLYSFSIEAPFRDLNPGEPSLVNVIKAVDAVGDTVTNYTGTVHFSSSDNMATLPADVSFQPFDSGVISLTNAFTFQTVGTQIYTVEDIGLPATASNSPNFNIQTGLSKSRSKSKGLWIDSWSLSRQQLLPQQGKWTNVTMKAELFNNGQMCLVEWRVMSGRQTLWSKVLSTTEQHLECQWNGVSNGGKRLDSGLYRLQLMVYKNQNEFEIREQKLELNGNIDVGSHGP